MTDAFEIARQEFRRLEAEQRNAIIEECARLVESFLHKDDAAPLIEDVAAAIRALKEKP